MALPLPVSLTPSKVASFKDCALAFRFSNIDRLPEPASPWAVKGTLVHRALELLFWDFSPGQRTIEAATACLARAQDEMASDPEFLELDLSDDDCERFARDAEAMVGRYFELEDPNQVRVIGVELRLEVRIGSLTLRGIIDRLELDANGDLVVTDYKTGRTPGARFEQNRLGGVHFYAFLCERLLGVRPAKVQLLYLGDGTAIETCPTEQSLRGLETRTAAIWTAVERACHAEDFRPKPSRLCDYCAFHEFCPTFGGDPSRAREVAALARQAARDARAGVQALELTAV